MNSTRAIYKKLHQILKVWFLCPVCLEVSSDTNQPDIAKPMVVLTSKTLFWNLDSPSTQENGKPIQRKCGKYQFRWVHGGWGWENNTDKINERNQGHLPWGDNEWCLEVGGRNCMKLWGFHHFFPSKLQSPPSQNYEQTRWVVNKGYRTKRSRTLWRNFASLIGHLIEPNSMPGSTAQDREVPRLETSKTCSCQS